MGGVAAAAMPPARGSWCVSRASVTAPQGRSSPAGAASIAGGGERRAGLQPGVACEDEAGRLWDVVYCAIR
jgi:hypothetical protein